MRGRTTRTADLRGGFRWPCVICLGPRAVESVLKFLYNSEDFVKGWWIVDEHRRAHCLVVATPIGFVVSCGQQLLRTNGIAVWDVLASCEREGAADAAIVTESARPNDFGKFVSRHPRLRSILFNGKEAESLYNTKVLPLYDANIEAMRRRRMPSTSPANAATSLAGLRFEWGEAIAECSRDE
jgi:hypoxanthine-DNA glycosylase